MGLFSNLLISAPTAPKENTVDVAAALRPFTVSGDYWNSAAGATTSKVQAMQVPAVMRARQIICGTIGSLPLEVYEKSTGLHIEAPRVVKQPDPSVPPSLIYTLTASDLFFFGNAYWQVTEMYATSDGGRVRAATFIPFERVSPIYNSNATAVVGYNVDGKPVPTRGIGSLVVFYGLNDGFLYTAGRTIRAALELEKAAELYAKEPIPTMVLKSTGTNLAPERVKALLESWKTSRTQRSTAFLNADIDLTTLGFDPKTLQLNEARQYIALELSRACGIPAHFLSAEVSSMTYSNTLQERRELVDFSLRPILTAIEQRLSMPDFLPSTQEARIDLDDFLRGSPLERAQVYEILNRIGAMSVEQIQEEEDLIR
jgi:HK97 family phage portal protein